MKNLKKVLTKALCISLAVGLCPVFQSSAETVSCDVKTDEVLFADTEFGFVFELVKVLSDYMVESNDPYFRSVGDKLNFENPAESKVEVIVNKKESGDKLKEFVESQGYDSDLLYIVVDPEFDPHHEEFVFCDPQVADPNATNTENTDEQEDDKVSFNDKEDDGVLFADTEFAFVFELIKALNDYWRENDIPYLRSFGDKLDLENPAESKVIATVIDEESVDKFKELVKSLGYDPNILYMVVDPDFNITYDIAIFECGDINNDTNVDLTDLTSLSLYLMKECEFDAYQTTLADVNGDEYVDISDLAHLKQFIMGEDIALGI